MSVLAVHTPFQATACQLACCHPAPPVNKFWICLENWLLIDFCIMGTFETVMKVVDPLMYSICVQI